MIAARTLESVFKDALLNEYPAWAANVSIYHPYTGKPLPVRETQITGLHDALSQDNHRFGLYDTMGAGKSLIAYMYTAFHAGIGNRVLTIMPPKLLRQYKNNFYAMLKGVPVWMEVFHGTPKERAKLAAKWKNDPPQVICTSPEMFRRDPTFFSKTLGCDVLVGDEAKWVSNEDTKIGEALDIFMGLPGERAALIMNGTPARSDLLNLYGYIQFTSPFTYTGIEHFKRRHINYDKFTTKVRLKSGREVRRQIKKIVGYKHVDKIYENLYKRGRRVEMSPPTETEVFYKEIDLEDLHYATYRRLVEEKLLIFEDNSLIDITEAAKVRHSCMRAIFDPAFIKVDGEGAVLETTREMLEEIDLTKTKVLLCAYYQTTVESLVKAFENHGAVALYGKVTGSKAEAAKQRFLKDDSCRVMVINYESGGVGLDGLQDVCYTGISVEPTPIPGDFEQTLGRLARPGQTQGVNMWCLIATGTIYKKIVNERLRRQAAISQVVKQHGRMTKEELRAELLGE